MGSLRSAFLTALQIRTDCSPVGQADTVSSNNWYILGHTPAQWEARARPAVHGDVLSVSLCMRKGLQGALVGIRIQQLQGHAPAKAPGPVQGPPDM